MDNNSAPQIHILSDEEFHALSTSEKADYLRDAIAARNAINRQIDAAITPDLIKKDG